jgi:hypothetical protein
LGKELSGPINYQYTWNLELRVAGHLKRPSQFFPIRGPTPATALWIVSALPHSMRILTYNGTVRDAAIIRIDGDWDGRYTERRNGNENVEEMHLGGKKIKRYEGTRGDQHG